MRGDQQAQQAFDVTDFNIVQQRALAGTLVGNRFFPQRLFIGAGMGALAQQDDDVAIAQGARAGVVGHRGVVRNQLVNPVGNHFAFTGITPVFNIRAGCVQWITQCRSWRFCVAVRLARDQRQ